MWNHGELDEPPPALRGAASRGRRGVSIITVDPRARESVVRRAVRGAGPLAPLLGFAFAALVFFSLSRVGLLLWYLRRLRAVPGFWRLVPVGVQLDVMTLGPALFLPAALVLLWPARGRRLLGALLGAYFAVVAGTMVLIEAATPPFLVEYDSRPNRVFVDYLAYPREVGPTVLADHTLAVVLALVLVAVAATAAAWLAVRLVAAGGSWPWGKRLAALPLVGSLLFLGARSSLGHRPANISAAAFSGNHLANELALNSTYAVAYAVYSRRHEQNAERLYGRLPSDEALTRVRRQTGLPAAAFPRSDIPLLHRQAALVPRARPLNLVVVLEESLGARFVGSLGGPPLTPNLDRLSAGGLFLTNLYATGTRTVRGLEAVVAGFPPTPSTSVVKLGLAQSDFFTVAELLRRHGYATEFLYGGAGNFDNMRGFFLNNGVERFLDESAFMHPTFRGTWGVADEDLFREAHERFLQHGDDPFFAVLLTTSNHSPYEYPAGRVEPFAGDARTPESAIRYADWALGEFFHLAEPAPYFARTLFVIVADHDARVFGADLVPIDHFHIPGLILGPDVPRRRDDRVASQIDLLPTALGLLGLDLEHPMPGRNLLAVPEETPGRALMQYDLVHAYRVGDDVIVQQPALPPQQFRWDGAALRPRALDPELARDALAHVQTPLELYRSRRYRLP